LGGTKPVPVSTEGKAIGVDLGLIDFAATSAGSKFTNPRHLSRAERNLKRKQRKLSRKRIGSKSRNKARVLVARAHERVSNARRDWLHKLSRRLVDENQVIAVEDLCVKAMVRSPTLSKSISDAGWGTFTRMIEYKAAWAGKAFVRIGRFFPSSRACSTCGAIGEKMPLNVRRWTCPHCGSAHDRDVNAAINIRDEALRLMAAGTVASAGGALVSRRRGRKPSTAREA
jgi:putative transposase